MRKADQHFSRFAATLLLFSILWATLFVPTSFAQENSPATTIAEIQFQGLKLIDQTTLWSNLNSAAGKKFHPNIVSADLKKLYNLGFFKDIWVELQEDPNGQPILIYHFEEKPRIKAISITGNRIVSYSDVEDDLSAFVNNMVRPSVIQKDIRLLRRKYLDKGYLNTSISYQLSDAGNNFVNLEYVVVESPRVYLTDIKITGTKYLYPIDVERLMQSAKIDCFSWVNSSGVFIEEKVSADLQLIKQRYAQSGFVNISIDRPKIIIEQDNDIHKISIHLNINEGESYNVGKINITPIDGGKLLFNKPEVMEEFALKEGNTYNPVKENQDKFKLNDIYSAQGYAFTQVKIDHKFDHEKRTVDITYQILKRQKFYIGRIEINGNYETLDYVIRRELEVHDKELFNGVKLRESQRKIIRLGFFESQSGVAIDRSQGENSSEINYDFNLHEAKTGSFQASLAYGAESGLAIQFSLSKKNLLGTGRSLSLSIEQKQIGESLFNISMVNPYFMGTKFTNNFSIFNQFNPNVGEYDTRSTGFSFGFSKELWKNMQGSGTYTYKDEKYSRITPLGTEALQGKTGNSSRSIKLGYGFSTVDNPSFPTNGTDFNINIEQFGGPFGGSMEYFSTSLLWRNFISLNEAKTITVMSKFQQGQLFTKDGALIPYHVRFRLGSMNTVRGHEYLAIEGPSGTYESGIDPKTKWVWEGDLVCPGDVNCGVYPAIKDPDRVYWETHIGGTLQRVFNVELLFPLTREGDKIRGVVFYDMGNVWSEDYMYTLAGMKKDLGYFRKSAGFGLRFITPMGVLRFEYSVKLDAKPTETASRFDFNISSLF